MRLHNYPRHGFWPLCRRGLAASMQRESFERNLKIASHRDIAETMPNCAILLGEDYVERGSAKPTRWLLVPSLRARLLTGTPTTAEAERLCEKVNFDPVNLNSIQKAQ